MLYLSKIFFKIILNGELFIIVFTHYNNLYIQFNIKNIRDKRKTN